MKKDNSKIAILAGLMAVMVGSAGCSAVNAANTTADLQTTNNSNTTAQVQKARPQGGGQHGAAANVVVDAVSVAAKTYTDGTYIGTGVGYAPGLKVQVTVKDNLITNVQIVSHNETPGFYEKAFNIVPDLIVEGQTTGVDTVSGATMSSKGIMSAVNAALKLAEKTTTVTTQ